MEDDCQDNLVTPLVVNVNKNVSNESSTEDLCNLLPIDNQIISTSENCESTVKKLDRKVSKKSMWLRNA